ncbi:quinone-dependent dihydroorotate dehydrogenase [Aliiglaciecola sp. CAU 1673]|uniref:quinone-dependent dihydroorotate dehydrogenase n=1 Tax=Aliiglaciecola sp. CAU 1673 TaxID=3032595 RepID=UPI0023DCDC8A|nr:quinone-dependent dihydroorotate dehydrogenase [Aliiglaciecola sp. CAU 1673]MDF2177526.1 quinone-dependent dihydroorotate dehydrogenase [Aliiglaciecola sp. CAU 1673]
MYSLIRPLLFCQDAEKAHDLSMGFLKHSQHTPLKLAYSQSVPDKPVELWGLTFRNPLGLAAGLDKNAECIDAFAAMGFGFIEVGTVTPRPQAGNDKPRLFRLPQANAIINRMGFNNKGVDYLVERVKEASYNGVLGINIGKNKDTPDEQALDDYLHCLNKVYEHASYVTVNISSPNTPGLRNLQYGEALDKLLAGLKSAQSRLADNHGKYVPLLVKIAPDLDDQQIDSIARSLSVAKMDGVIATNTTLSRQAVKDLPHGEEAGGLSGEPLTTMSQDVVVRLKHALGGAMPIIGVGGIHSAETAKSRLVAGASLLQIYSSFIYQGPGLVKEIVRAL